MNTRTSRTLMMFVMLAIPFTALAQRNCDPAQGLIDGDCPEVSGRTGRIADKLRPAAVEDFIGFWEVVPYPDALQPKRLPMNPWPESCQVFGHHKDGRYSRFFAMTKQDPCKSEKESFWEVAAIGMPSVSAYKVLGGFALITHREHKITEVWKIQIVTEAFEAPGIEAREGDLIMELVNLQAKQVLWRRILRRVPQ